MARPPFPSERKPGAHSVEHRDTWAEGDRYEPYVGRWSRLVAGKFLPWLSVPAGGDWLDVGCGTGALTQAILESAAPRSVVGVDPSGGYVEHARARLASALVCFQIGDAQSLSVESASIDAAVSGLALNFVPEPPRAVSEMVRVTRPGGVVAAYVWDYAGKMELIRYFWDAATALDPAALDSDEGRRFPICAPGPLLGLFESAGLRDVGVVPLDVPTRFRDLDDYWSPFLGGEGPAPAYAMSLSEERRAKLRDRIVSRLPISSDGSVCLTARAWAVRGAVPT
jgi:SAM-dependent methyltransferase